MTASKIKKLDVPSVISDGIWFGCKDHTSLDVIKNALIDMQLVVGALDAQYPGYAKALTALGKAHMAVDALPSGMQGRDH